MNPVFTVRLASWSEARALAAPLRHAVFIEEQGVPMELEWDEYDALSSHALASLKDSTVVGTGRLLPDDSAGAARIGRMAVRHDWRRRGVGTLLLKALLGAACSRGTQYAIIHAQLAAVPFYRRFRFTRSGLPFEEAEIPHIEMRRPFGRAME